MSLVPLLQRTDQFPIFQTGDRQIGIHEFLSDIYWCVERLPDSDSIINLCESRYSFIVVFFASLLRSQTNFLPQIRGQVGAETASRFQSSAKVVTDSPKSWSDVYIELAPGENGQGHQAIPYVDEDHVACVAFTSGSTGNPKSHDKSWGSLASYRNEHLKAFRQECNVSSDACLTIVPTVPPWHMYGLEWSVLLPTIGPFCVDVDTAAFPVDIAKSIHRASTDVILISTPIHLRALCNSGLTGLEARYTVSATAELEVSLAELVESRMNSAICEVYGCTEIGSLAVRKPTEYEGWHFLDPFDVKLENDQLYVSSPLFEGSVKLQDRFSFDMESGAYLLLGRNDDIVKLGGKRESLAKLNNTLLMVEGVEDAVIISPNSLHLPSTGRLEALVVAPGISAKTIRQELLKSIDPVFVPRPMYFVPSLPRDITSKLPVSELKNLLISSRNENPR